MISFILMALWGVGGTMIIYLAGLQSIPTELTESATIDGANTVQRFLQHHPSAAHPDHLLQPDHWADRRFPDL